MIGAKICTGRVWSSDVRVALSQKEILNFEVARLMEIALSEVFYRVTTVRYIEETNAIFYNDMIYQRNDGAFV